MLESNATRKFRYICWVSEEQFYIIKFTYLSKLIILYTMALLNE